MAVLRAFVVLVLGLTPAFLSADIELGKAHTKPASPRGAYDHAIAFEADYLLMSRSDGSDRPLVITSGGPYDLNVTAPACCDGVVDKVVLTTKDLINDQGYTPGVSASFYIYPNHEHSLEGRWMGLLSWHGDEKVSCTQNLGVPGVGNNTYDYSYADEVEGKYNSRLWGAEFDYIKHLTPRYINPFALSARAGLHYFEVKEELEMAFKKVGYIVKLSDIETSPYVWDHSMYRINTKSKFFGLQAGMDFDYNAFSFLTWGIRVKGGLGANWGESKTWMGDLNDTIILLDYGNGKSNFSYFFTGYPFIELRPVKNWSFIIDYEMLYLGAITVAEKQAIFNNTLFDGRYEPVNNRGYLLCHGLRLALKCNF